MYKIDKNDLFGANEWISILITVGIVIVIIILCNSCVKISDDRNWGNGYCSCGGKWVYKQAIGHYYSTNYIYECDKCGKHIEMNKER